MLDDAYLSTVIEVKFPWFSQMKAQELIYYQSFFTADSLGCNPTLSQFIQPLNPKTLEVPTIAILLALCGEAPGEKETLRFLKMNIKVYCARLR